MSTRTLGSILLFVSSVVAAAEPPLSHEEIKSVVDSHLGEVKACMGEHGSATGKLVVEFGILPNGKVTDPKPKERSSNAALDKCIAKAFAAWSFPKPRSSITMGVNYPFLFSVPPPPVAGKLEQQQVAAVVHAHQSEIDFCYAEATKEQPGLQGTVRVAFVIAPSGQVLEAQRHETSSVASPKLSECLVARVKSWQFPQPSPSGEFAVIYPFIFAVKAP